MFKRNLDFTVDTQPFQIQVENVDEGEYVALVLHLRSKTDQQPGFWLQELYPWLRHDKWNPSTWAENADYDIGPENEVDYELFGFEAELKDYIEKFGGNPNAIPPVSGTPQEFGYEIAATDPILPWREDLFTLFCNSGACQSDEDDRSLWKSPDNPWEADGIHLDPDKLGFIAIEIQTRDFYGAPGLAPPGFIESLRDYVVANDIGFDCFVQAIAIEPGAGAGGKTRLRTSRRARVSKRVFSLNCNLASYSLPFPDTTVGAVYNVVSKANTDFYLKFEQEPDPFLAPPEIIALSATGFTRIMNNEWEYSSCTGGGWLLKVHCSADVISGPMAPVHEGTLDPYSLLVEGQVGQTVPLWILP